MAVKGERGDPAGYAAMVSVYLIWGAMPAYWKLLGGIEAAEVLSHRTLWAFLLLIAVAAVRKEGPALLGALAIRGNPVLILVSGAALAVQWIAYLVAVETDRLVEMSMGYFIYPLVMAPLGAVLFKERISLWRLLALAFAGAGVLFLVARQGRTPVLALVLALSFAVYSVVKKRIKATPFQSSLLELGLLAPFAAAYLIAGGKGGAALGGGGSSELLLLAGGGVLTALTLLLFGEGARRVPLFTVGILQYISPTAVLLMGILVYGEAFDSTRLVAFLFIWIAVAAAAVQILKDSRSSA